MLEENCYLLWDDDKNAIIIDCGAFYPEEQTQIRDFIIEKKLNLKKMLNTHAHFDHLFGASFIHVNYGVGLSISSAEKQTYETALLQPRQFMHCDIPLKLAPVDVWFNDGDEIKVGSMVLKVIATPGHTLGGVCFYSEKNKVLFSGDSLFRGQIGRCDFPGGNEYQLIKGLKERILTLPNDVQVLPGHGMATTIGDEKVINPFLR